MTHYVKAADGWFHCPAKGCTYRHKMARCIGRHAVIHKGDSMPTNDPGKKKRGRPKKTKLAVVVNNTNPDFNFKGAYEVKQRKSEDEVREEIVSAYCTGYIAHFIRNTADSARIATSGLTERVARALLALSSG